MTGKKNELFIPQWMIVFAGCDGENSIAEITYRNKLSYCNVSRLAQKMFDKGLLLYRTGKDNRRKLYYPSQKAELYQKQVRDMVDKHRELDLND